MISWHTVVRPIVVVHLALKSRSRMRLFPRTACQVSTFNCSGGHTLFPRKRFQNRSNFLASAMLLTEQKFLFCSGMWVLFWFLFHVLQLLPIRFTHMMHWQICDEASANIGLNIGPPLIKLWVYSKL